MCVFLLLVCDLFLVLLELLLVSLMYLLLLILTLFRAHVGYLYLLVLVSGVLLPFSIIERWNNSLGSLCQVFNDTIFGSQVLMAVPLQVLLCMCGVPVHCGCKASVRFWHLQSVKKGHGPIWPCSFNCEHYVWVYGIYLLKKPISI